MPLAIYSFGSARKVFSKHCAVIHFLKARTLHAPISTLNDEYLLFAGCHAHDCERVCDHGSGRYSLAHAAPAAAAHASINCATGALVCMEVAKLKKTFGKYVGHDEPSDLFYSNVPGSGNQMRYTLTLPRDPSPSPPRRQENRSISNCTRRSGSVWLCATRSPILI